MYGPGLMGVLGAGGGFIGTVVAGATVGRLADTGWPILMMAVAGAVCIVAGLAVLRLAMRRTGQ